MTQQSFLCSTHYDAWEIQNGGNDRDGAYDFGSSNVTAKNTAPTSVVAVKEMVSMTPDPLRP